MNTPTRNNRLNPSPILTSPTSDNANTLEQQQHPPTSLPGGLSPALKKKLDQESVEARAQRLTPTLSDLEHLYVRTSCQEMMNGSSSSISTTATGATTTTAVEPSSPQLAREHSFRGMGSLSYRSPKGRRSRVQTFDGKLQIMKDIASTERMKRNTDSMLEDCVIANKLKRRLISRKMSIANTDFSDFLKKSIMEGSLDAVSAAWPTDESLSTAADNAMKVILEGYFENMEDASTKEKARHIFLESLIRQEFSEGEYICRKNDVGDKLYIIEEGICEFRIGNQVPGVAKHGSIFGELSLVYGIPRAADVKAVTPCVIVWSMDALSFRRIQALVANESLKASTTLQSKKSAAVKKHRQQFSSLTDLQERNRHSITTPIDFKNLKRCAIIGKGTFGSVYLVLMHDKEKKKDRYLALKSMSKTSIVDRKNQERVLIEKNVLQQLDSPFIISLFGTHQDETSIYFLTDFVQGGNLMTYMINKDVLSHSESMFFAANIVAALSHVHKEGLVHRDIKPENCLISKDGYIKICDFGMAKRLPATVVLPCGGTEVVTLAFTMCGTPEFMAPEFVLSTGYNKGVDWWALGCILVEMYTGRSPFEFDGDLKKTFKEICLIGMGKKKFITPDEFNKSGLETAAEFIQSLLTTAKDRLGSEELEGGGGEMSDLRKHAYFNDIDFEQLHNHEITAPYLPNISNASDVSHFKREVQRCSDDSAPDVFKGDANWCKDF